MQRIGVPRVTENDSLAAYSLSQKIGSRRATDGRWFMDRTSPVSGRLCTALTGSERAVLRYAAYGWSNRRISRKLCLSEQTVKNRL
ncbi:MAG: response regulator transcription factor, partial [Rubrobacteraceae bacterium]|nr:response regulator transcription factor [Rubrobacteraceae bacterium]